jgi:hypothetical protein
MSPRAARQVEASARRGREIVDPTRRMTARRPCWIAALGGASRAAALVALLAALASCAGTRYARAWISNGADIEDTLFIAGGSFRLERVSPEGVSVFSGTLQVDAGEWTFTIQSWQPTGADVRQLQPPVVYRYRGHSFENGIAFFSSQVLAGVLQTFFIHTPIDFDVVR